MNGFLLVGGGLSVIAAVLHIVIIFGGAEWYRYFGAGERMAKMSEQGSIIPGLITFFIALVLFVWGLYAFAGTGLIQLTLPFVKYPDPHLEERKRVQVFGFTVYSKNLSFTHRLSGHFLDVLWNQRLVLYSFF